MKLLPPFLISSRLLPALHVAGAWLSLEHVGYGAYGKAAYRWYIDLDGEEYSAADLCGHEPLQAMFGSLLCFLSACGEGVNYQERTGRDSENADLFPPSVAEWAAANTDELDMLRCEIEETEAELIEE